MVYIVYGKFTLHGGFNKLGLIDDYLVLLISNIIILK